jgi:aspartokinase-like uncharacterized kinase
MRVIKLGGSLAQSGHLQACLDAIESNHPNHHLQVIVPGGGDFADQVRLAQHHWSFDDTTAHAMAILAMQQMALLFKGLKPNFKIADSVADINQTPLNSHPVIWSPAIAELNRAGVTASWDITSDSLAAWLAISLSADELVLVKSAAIDSNLNLPELAERGLIDRAFPETAKTAAFILTIINAHDFNG